MIKLPGKRYQEGLCELWGFFPTRMNIISLKIGGFSLIYGT